MEGAENAMVALGQRLDTGFAEPEFAHQPATPSGCPGGRPGTRPARRRPPLYTAEERIRRDRSPWTLVQGILAPLQFLVFLVSLALVVRFLLTGEGQGAATLSILVKTGVLYLIMVTGAIWEKAVFGRYLFAPAFFWEDVVSMLVLALHTAYVGMLIAGIGTVGQQMAVALAAYAAYVVNAAQFVRKLRMARLDAAAGAPA
jgi:3-vinyl bacteriochlorophyllide hydratase